MKKWFLTDNFSLLIQILVFPKITRLSASIWMLKSYMASPWGHISLNPFQHKVSYKYAITEKGVKCRYLNLAHHSGFNVIISQP